MKCLKHSAEELFISWKGFQLLKLPSDTEFQLIVKTAATSDINASGDELTRSQIRAPSKRNRREYASVLMCQDQCIGLMAMTTDSSGLSKLHSS